MALHINKEHRSVLQERVASELQEKARKRAAEDSNRPDGVDDSNYIKDTKQTTTLSGVWAVIGIAAIVVVIWLVVAST